MIQTFWDMIHNSFAVLFLDSCKLFPVTFVHDNIMIKSQLE